MNTKQLAEGIRNFLYAQYGEKYADSVSTYETAADIEASFSDVEQIASMIYDINYVIEAADLDGDDKEYANELIKDLRNVRTKLENAPKKRMVADTGYEVTNAIRIGGCEILTAVNPAAPGGNIYMSAEYVERGIFAEYSNVAYSADYLSIMRLFAQGIERQIAAIEAEHANTNQQAEPITADQCHPHDYAQNLVNEVVAIKASSLLPEYRRGDAQLVYVTGGNGARGNARGSAVFCTHLGNGENTRFERCDVQGIIKEIPTWAQARLAAIQAERAPKAPPAPEIISGYTILKRIDVGDKHFALGENPAAPSPYVTWQGMKGRSGYDIGHYFSDRSDAERDLHKRTDDERNSISKNKGWKPKSRDDAR